MRNVFVTLPTYPGSVYKPKWDKRVKLETHFRVTGPVADDGKSMLPCRLSAAVDDFSDWLHIAKVFDGGSASRVTFVAEMTDEHGQPRDPTFPTPVDDFIDTVYKLAKNDPALKVYLLDGGRDKPRAVKRPKDHGFIQGVLFRHGETSLYAKPKFPVCLILGPAALRALLETMNTRNEQFSGASDDYAGMFAPGDITHIAQGRLLSFYNPSVATSEDEANQEANWGSAPGVGTDTRAERDDTDIGRYACEVRPKAMPLPVDATGKLVIPPAQLFTPWNKTIRRLDEKSMIDMLVRAFSDVPHVLRAAFALRADMLPPSIMKGRSVSATGGQFDAGGRGAPAHSAPATTSDTVPTDDELPMAWVASPATTEVADPDAVVNADAEKRAAEAIAQLQKLQGK